MHDVSERDLRTALLHFLDRSERLLFVVLGPTAGGKTDFSLKLCTLLRDRGKGPEVVNADSRQLYRTLDIGTAKITEDERGSVPHHMIDVLDPKEEATAGWYQREARRVIDEILEREGVPVLVGGSMLYVSSIIDGLSLAPVPDAALRERLMNEYDMDRGVTLHRKLRTIDPQAAEQIHRHNKPRLVRAVEIFELTRWPKSEATMRSELRSRSTDRYDLFIIGVTRPRLELYQRINDRVLEMFDAGWIEEVLGVLSRGYTPIDPGMKSHGYREIVEYLQSGQNDLESLQEIIATKTRKYAKRQLTWWRPDSRIHWITSPMQSARSPETRVR